MKDNKSRNDFIITRLQRGIGLIIIFFETFSGRDGVLYLYEAREKRRLHHASQSRRRHTVSAVCTLCSMHAYYRLKSSNVMQNSEFASFSLHTIQNFASFFQNFTHKSKNCTQNAKHLTSLAKWSTVFKISHINIFQKLCDKWRFCV